MFATMQHRSKQFSYSKDFLIIHTKKWAPQKLSISWHFRIANLQYIVE